MSANNFILIEWKKDHYEISHRDADTNSELGKSFNEKTLDDAVYKANAIIEEIQSEGGYVEYGISIIPRPRNSTSIRRDVSGQGRIASNDNQTE